MKESEQLMSINDLLPQNIEAEMGVLGSLIIDREAIVQIAEFLHPDDFYRDMHRTIYAAILDLYESREPADFITICEELERRDKLEHIGASYITSLIGHVPTSANVEHYAHIIADRALERRLIGAGVEIQVIAQDRELSTAQKMEKVEQLVYALRTHNTTSHLTDHRQGLARLIDKLGEQRSESGIVSGIPTGIGALDKLTGGWQPSDLIILAARTSIGKSAFALHTATHAISCGKSVLVFSLEMSEERVWRRLLSMKTGIDQARLRSGWILNDTIQIGERIYDGEWALIGEKSDELIHMQGTLRVDDTRGVTSTHIRSVARRVKQEHGLDFVIVDYAQLMKPTEKAERRDLDISAFTKALRELAGELEIPVMALAQLNRQGDGVEPQLPHLKESGSLEEDADVVAFLWTRPEQAEIKAEGGKPYNIELKVAKQRDGALGSVTLRFEPHSVRFSEVI